MKKIIIAGMGLLLMTTAVSCKKKQMKKLEGTITEGTWKITQFTHDNVDETAQYAGSTFTFHSDGTLTVSGSVSLNGTWDVRKEDDSDDDIDLFDDKHLELYISLPAPYGELTDDWEVKGRSDTRISLEDDSNSKGDDDDNDDYLVFEKM